MRRYISPTLVALLFVFGPLGSATGQARWEVAQDAPEGNLRQRHDDIKFLPNGTGWLVNTSGQIWRSGDFGNRWEQQYETNGAFLFRSVAPLNNRVAFVGTVNTPGSVLFRTADGGDTWTDISNSITGTTPAGICGMSVASDFVIYGVGAFHGVPTVIKTSNGGITWNGRSVRPLAETLVDVHFFDELSGIAVGGTSDALRGNAVVLRTEDGGSSWQRAFETTRASGIVGEWGWKISFPSRLIGYVSVEYASNTDGQNAKVLKTEDGGVSWREVPVTGSVSRAGLQGIGFRSETVGWASGRGVTSMTEDGGETWTQLTHWATDTPSGQLDGSVNRFLMVSDTLALAVGRRVYRLTGSGAPTAIATPPIPETFSLSDMYPNPFDEQTNMEYSLDFPGIVRVEIIDALGRRHGVILSEEMPAGRHTLTWDGTDQSGQRLPAGMYMLLVDIDHSPEMKQVVLIR